VDLQLAGRVVIVAGSSRGIGRSIAAALIDEGAAVCVTGRDALSLAEAHAELSARGQAIAHVGDLTNAQAIDELYATVDRELGTPDALVANVGSGAGKPGWDQTEEEWERLLTINLRASVRLAQAAIPRMQTAGRGSIVFIASIAGVESTPAPLPYSAAKAALVNYGKNLARSVAEFGIRVNSVAPGNILFPGGSWERHLVNRPEAVATMLANDVPMHRFGTPQEIADLVAFLCSDRASFVTGACFVADGGQTRKI